MLFSGNIWVAIKRAAIVMLPRSSAIVKGQPLSGSQCSISQPWNKGRKERCGKKAANKLKWPTEQKDAFQDQRQLLLKVTWPTRAGVLSTENTLLWGKWLPSFPFLTAFKHWFDWKWKLPILLELHCKLCCLKTMRWRHHLKGWWKKINTSSLVIGGVIFEVKF